MKANAISTKVHELFTKDGELNYTRRVMHYGRAERVQIIIERYESKFFLYFRIFGYELPHYNSRIRKDMSLSQIFELCDNLNGFSPCPQTNAGIKAAELKAAAERAEKDAKDAAAEIEKAAERLRRAKEYAKQAAAAAKQAAAEYEKAAAEFAADEKARAERAAADGRANITPDERAAAGILFAAKVQNL